MKFLRSLPCLIALALLLGCADRAVIGALCPVGCELRARDSVCDCAAKPGRPDASACSGDSCPADAASAATVDATCAANGCEPAAGGGGSMCPAGPLAGKQLDLMLVLDDGASLLPWWGPMSEGLSAFLKEDASSGIGIGLQRFGEVCEPEAYVPPIVPIQPLPASLPALEAAIPPTAMITNSTIPALDAAERYAKSWSTDHPDAHVAVVLITDASPGACDGLNGNYAVEAARLAQAAHLSRPSIKTYVVGIGSLELIDNIALAGGTQPQRIPITATSADVLNALRIIRRAAQDTAQLELSRACQNDP